MRKLSIAVLLLGFGPAVVRAEDPRQRWVSMAELPAAIRPAGTLVTAVGWRDASGDNVAAFWSKDGPEPGTVRLQVDVWSGKRGEKGAIVRSVRDGISDCEHDATAEFIDSALGVTDMDKDGHGELTFAYRTGCTATASPLTLKLLVLERRDKYAIEGTTLIEQGDGKHLGGAKQIDEALQKQEALRTHAERVWKQIVSS